MPGDRLSLETLASLSGTRSLLETSRVGGGPRAKEGGTATVTQDHSPTQTASLLLGSAVHFN